MIQVFWSMTLFLDYPDNGGNKFFRNICNCAPVDRSYSPKNLDLLKNYCENLKAWYTVRGNTSSETNEFWTSASQYLAPLQVSSGYFRMLWNRPNPIMVSNKIGGISIDLHSIDLTIIHSVFYLTTGPKPPPKRCLHIVRSRASSFKWEYPLLSLRSSSSFLRLLPRLLATSISPFIIPSITCFRRQFLRFYLQILCVFMNMGIKQTF